MSFSLTKGYPLHPQGKYDAVIQKIWMERDCEVVVKGKKKKSDLVKIEYGTQSGEVSQNYLPVMDVETDLGLVVKSINGGIIPDHIKDAEKFFVGKKIGIDVKHNKSSKSGRTFANVVSVYPLDEEDDDQDEDEDDSVDEDEMLDDDSDDADDEDSDSDEPDDDEELDLDLDEDLDDSSDSDSDLDLDEELEEEQRPKKQKRRGASTWKSNTFAEDANDFED
ncbi:hypothetical protein [Brevibacillus borstelensis]|uniref:hypothetical protein n=1 Tax=Brevibacillus borstelensis TaxID=45462 RepID=UPI001D0A96CA|nr:hypothetical protein [Brevibacillus borstelensis]MCC0566951.1 hypothetical protein [Brevibacillus borstelensis]